MAKALEAVSEDHQQVTQVDQKVTQTIYKTEAERKFEETKRQRVTV